MGHMYGDKFKFYPVASVSESLDELSRGKYDILVADIPVIASLKERFRLSVPVYTDRMVLVSRDTTITSPLQLAGQSVWVVAGAPSVERLENLSREIGDSIDICDTHTYTAEQLVMLVAAGEIPRAVVNRAVAEKLLPEYTDVKISTHISFSQFQSWIMNKNTTRLADSIDAQIERFKLTPDYQALIEKFEIWPRQSETDRPIIISHDISSSRTGGSQTPHAAIYYRCGDRAACRAIGVPAEWAGISRPRDADSNVWSWPESRRRDA